MYASPIRMNSSPTGLRIKGISALLRMQIESPATAVSVSNPSLPSKMNCLRPSEMPLITILLTALN
jgi:hypothetical protein